MATSSHKKFATPHKQGIKNFNIYKDWLALIISSSLYKKIAMKIKLLLLLLKQVNKVLTELGSAASYAIRN